LLKLHQGLPTEWQFVVPSQHFDRLPSARIRASGAFVCEEGFSLFWLQTWGQEFLSSNNAVATVANGSSADLLDVTVQLVQLVTSLQSWLRLPV